MPLATTIKKSVKRTNKPIWDGPCSDGPQGGVTQGLLSRYLSCKHRFWVLTIEGWKQTERFSAALEFGNLWHACEEQFAANGKADQRDAVRNCASDLDRKYPMQREEIDLWAAKCNALFPIYAEHWRQHPDVLNRKPLMQERVFDVPYELPSGRCARLRGKWDSVDFVADNNAKRGDGQIWLQENKSKSGIDQQKIANHLTFDLQSMVYLVALDAWTDRRHEYILHDRDTELAEATAWTHPLVGVRYNVVRRPLHKSVESMLEKVQLDQRCGRSGEWFARWNVEVSAGDVAKFKRQTLDPVLENLCDDYEWWSHCADKRVDVFDYAARGKTFKHQQRHYRVPYHYDPLSEGGSGGVDNYLATGSTAGMHRVENLFPELQS